MKALYLIIPLAPLLGAIVAGLFGRVIGRAGAHWVTILAVLLIAMIAVTVFTLLKRDAGIAERAQVSTGATLLTYVLTFALGVYGGLYSGGYVTMLTAAYVAFFGMTFTEAVASTKLINVFSSLIASAIFAWQGLIDIMRLKRDQKVLIHGGTGGIGSLAIQMNGGLSINSFLNVTCILS